MKKNLSHRSGIDLKLKTTSKKHTKIKTLNEIVNIRRKALIFLLQNINAFLLIIFIEKRVV